MTERLFDRSAYLRRFHARVRYCIATEDGKYSVLLDATAFAPEGGGQGPDQGTIGGVRVLDVQESEGEIFHLLEGPIPGTGTVEGVVDRACRLRHMQNHTGEHILSGLAHRMYGCENVGFHLGPTEVTMDYDRPLSEEQIAALETAANEVVRDNKKVTARYPAPEELAAMTYRSKKEIRENVRIVSIQDVDDCACCAPHCATTSEVGAILILSAEHYKGGMRFRIACGGDALAYARDLRRQARHVSHLLSAEIGACDLAVDRLWDDCREAKAALAECRRTLWDERIAAARPTERGAVLFSARAEEADARRYINAVMPATPGPVGCFWGEEGRYQFVIGCREGGLETLTARLHTELGARCGGSPVMISGRATATKEQITAVLGLD